jgi:secreted trypsin-like serine protease
VSVAGRLRRCCSYVRLALSIGVAAGALAWGSVTVTAQAHTGRRPRARASVVGGGNVQISRFPFQVALYNPAAGSPMAGFFCGGVIVDATHVITAAHCLAGGGHGRGGVSGEVAVLAGSTRLDRPDAGSVRDPAASVSVDPYYNPYTNDYDIGVVALAHPLWAGSTAPSANGANAIAPLPIDVAGAADYGEATSAPTTLATVSGWGDTNPAPSGSPRYPSALRASSVPLVGESLCQEEYAAIEQSITPRMLCAGSSRPRADSCYGDSGGPLVVDRDSPARPPADYVLVGLVDFGNGCAQPGFAGVYTRIADPAIARFLASDVAHRAKVSVHRSGRKRKRKRHRAHR